MSCRATNGLAWLKLGMLNKNTHTIRSTFLQFLEKIFVCFIDFWKYCHLRNKPKSANKKDIKHVSFDNATFLKQSQLKQ